MFFVLLSQVFTLALSYSFIHNNRDIRNHFKYLSMSTSTTTTKNFVKYHGLGNDFILVDNRKSTILDYSNLQAIKLCDRNFGIGADGLIFTLPGQNNCKYTMRIYNSDGTEPQMCGNGIRCMAKYLQHIENKENQQVSYKIWTNAGEIIAHISTDNLITIDMGEPILDPPRVPTLLPPTKDGKVIDSELEVLGKIYKTSCVSMGNPHSVSLYSFFNFIIFFLVIIIY
jgi:diaminopimelate epimerase